jgi:isoamylase
MDSYGWNYRNNRWAKWLGRYRDKVRRLSQSNLKDTRAFKQLLEGYGSVSDSYGVAASTKPWRSINLIAVHDGYTMRDCLYFNDSNGSHNCWNSNNDENLRRERSKFLLGILLTSQGVPLILQGDEFGRTKASAQSQADAHNTYNYESTTGDPAINHVNWIDWRLKDGDNSGSPTGPTYGKELFHWTKGLIALRKRWSHFHRADFPVYTRENGGAHNDGQFSYSWEGPSEGEPSQLAVVWWGKEGEPDLMVIYNEHWSPFTINNLRDWSQGDWKVLARSWFGDDQDLCGLADWETSRPDAGGKIEVKGRSMVILISDND